MSGDEFPSLSASEGPAVPFAGAQARTTRQLSCDMALGLEQAKTENRLDCIGLGWGGPESDPGREGHGLPSQGGSWR